MELYLDWIVLLIPIVIYIYCWWIVGVWMSWELWPCRQVMGKFSCDVRIVENWIMVIMALENGKLTYFHAILKLFLFGLIHLWWRCVLIVCVLIMALKALYECYCIVILLYMNEAICKVLYEAICKVLCEAICEGMMWMSFMWSYIWRNDVNAFYVILWWSYVKWIALWVKVWFLMMYMWNDVGLWSILKWKCCDLVGRLKCPSLLLKFLNAWMCEMGKTKKWCPFYEC